VPRAWPAVFKYSDRNTDGRPSLHDSRAIDRDRDTALLLQ
jgi:hypothetical protein